MTHLKSFVFPSGDMETDYLWKIDHTCYDSFYPFKIMSRIGLSRLDFEPVTILYGGNGSGKSTALNVIAEKTGVKRDSLYNRTNFYSDYVGMCEIPLLTDVPENSRIITSDDVFDHMLDVRSINEGIDNKRDDLFREHMEFTDKKSPKYYGLKLKSLNDYDEYKRVWSAKSKTQSHFVRSELINNFREYSNGESAYKYFIEKIEENGLYLLDEPENSLSPKRQTELAKFIEESARFFECQFIISTHSPFLLSMKEAKIYDLDANPACVKRWTELENIRIYREFFQAHDGEF